MAFIFLRVQHVCSSVLKLLKTTQLVCEYVGVRVCVSLATVHNPLMIKSDSGYKGLTWLILDLELSFLSE